MTEPDGTTPAGTGPAAEGPVTVTGIARRALASSGGPTGLAVASAPAVAFVVANALGGLTPALVTLAVTAVVAFAVRLLREESLKGALIGLAIAAACALVAAVTGEARAFFLIPTLLPAAIILICLGSVLARRPLTGLLLNRLVGGPADWRHHPGLLRVYTRTTLVAVAVNVVNFAVQAMFYLANQPAVLAAAHVATGPVFATLVAATVVAARRRVTRPAGPTPCGT